MSFTYQTVTLSVNGVDYPVYGNQEAADAYLFASITAASWLTAADDLKAQALISAARWLDVLSWLGKQVDAAQAHAWPRSGISGVNAAAIPAPVVAASFELAALLLDDPTLFTSLSDPIPRSLRAGPVGIDFFRPLDVQWSGVVPKAVLLLIQPFLNAGGNPAGGPTPSGHQRTELPDDFDFVHGL